MCRMIIALLLQHTLALKQDCLDPNVLAGCGNWFLGNQLMDETIPTHPDVFGNAHRMCHDDCTTCTLCGHLPVYLDMLFTGGLDIQHKL